MKHFWYIFFFIIINILSFGFSIYVALIITVFNFDSGGVLVESLSHSMPLLAALISSLVFTQFMYFGIRRKELVPVMIVSLALQYSITLVLYYIR